MSILIKGMEMPTKCADCLFIDYFKGQWYCHSINDILETGSSKRDERCNLVPVPPHGRLIDGDVAEVIPFTADDAEGRDFYDGILFAADWISKQPTIIEAKEET